jgi:hypothetical protein
VLRAPGCATLTDGSGPPYEQSVISEDSCCLTYRQSYWIWCFNTLTDPSTNSPCATRPTRRRVARTWMAYVVASSRTRTRCLSALDKSTTQSKTRISILVFQVFMSNSSAPADSRRRPIIDGFASGTVPILSPSTPRPFTQTVNMEGVVAVLTSP